MLRQEEIQNLAGREVYDRNDDKIGRAGQVYLNADTDQPEWLCINTGLFGMKESFVPLRDAQIKGDVVYVAYDKAQVKNAPNIDPDESGMSGTQVQELYSYYGKLGWHAPQADDTGQRRDTGRARRDDAMTRSEERMRVGTTREETGKARLRKYVVTEQVQTTVPVRHEEVRVEREPITDANRDAALGGPDITEAEHEVTLHAERPVVEKETVPVERVRMTKEATTDEETVGGEVRKEKIDTEIPESQRRRRR
jgi:uncharacterized protein (TIGR02271 family)